MNQLVKIFFVTTQCLIVENNSLNILYAIGAENPFFLVTNFSEYLIIGHL